MYSCVTGGADRHRLVIVSDTFSPFLYFRF